MSPNRAQSDHDKKIHVNGALAVAIYRRLAQILDAHCSGYLIIHDEAFNWGYIQLRRAFQELLTETPPLASIAESDDVNVLPPSLSELRDVEADMWDDGLGATVRRLEGTLLVACANSGIDPFDQAADGALNQLGYDTAIQEYIDMKEVETQKFFARHGIVSPDRTSEPASAFGSTNHEQQEVDQEGPKLPGTLTGNNLTIVKLWLRGDSAREIGEQLYKAPKTIHNIVTQLRREYGDDVVPRRRQG